MKELRFSEMCRLLQDSLNENHTQTQVVKILYDCGVALGAQKGIGDALNDTFACRLFNNNAPVNQEMVREVIEGEKDKKEYGRYYKYKEYVNNKIFLNISDRGKFFDKLCDMIKEMPDSNAKNELERYVAHRQIGEGQIEDYQKKFLQRAIYYAFIIPNSNNQIKKIQKEEYKNFDKLNGDPHGLNKRNSNSTAIRIKVMDKEQQEKKVFYHFELCIEYIMQHCLRIDKIKVGQGYIQIEGDEVPELSFRRVMDEDKENVLKLLERNKSDFVEKRSWRGREIHTLAKRGLQEDIWLGYAYFFENQPVGYLDTKIRTDGDIEIGIEFVEEEYRNRGLGKSLVYLARLKYFAARIYAGTYEGNIGMERVFRETGFKENIFINGTNKLQERIDSEAPDDKSKDKNSIYFLAEALINDNLSK